MKNISVMVVFGTRPEAIKMAPLIKKLENNKKINLVIAVTAQHREMLDQVLDLFDIKADYDLDIMEKSQSLSGVTSRVIKGLDKIFTEKKPDLVLVHGDTSTTFVASLAAFYKKISIGHVEAGLRTNNKYSPFPEEMNRQLTGRIADFHFAPTLLAKNNLLKENIHENKIWVTGNTVIDALFNTIKDEYHFKNELLNKIDFKNKKIILLTTHRRENLGKPMENIFSAVKDIATKRTDTEVVFPIHLNPAVREIANKYFFQSNNIHLIEPLEYEPFVNLMNLSYLVLTDSGGIQEEAPSLGKPVLVLRNTTERPEAIKMGTVKKVGTEYNKIFKETNRLLNSDEYYTQISNSINPYGDGVASERIVNKILFEYDLLENPGKEFKL